MTSIDPRIEHVRGALRRRHPGRPPFGPGASDPAFAGPPPVPPFSGPVDDDDPGRRPGRGRGRRGHRGGPPVPPGFGFGGPGGPRGFDREMRSRLRGGRRTARGDIRAAVLALVAEQPRHGYEIIQEIAQRTGGAWRPSPGSVYPTLSQLEDEGLVGVEKTDGRRVVTLTEAGTAYVAEHRAEVDAVWESAGTDADDPAVGLWEQLGQLHAAAQQVIGAGTPEQIATATAAITEARKTIYRLLAE